MCFSSPTPPHLPPPPPRPPLSKPKPPPRPTSIHFVINTQVSTRTRREKARHFRNLNEIEAPKTIAISEPYHQNRLDSNFTDRNFGIVGLLTLEQTILFQKQLSALS